MRTVRLTGKDSVAPQQVIGLPVAVGVQVCVALHIASTCGSATAMMENIMIRIFIKSGIIDQLGFFFSNVRQVPVCVKMC